MPIYRLMNVCLCTYLNVYIEDMYAYTYINKFVTTYIDTHVCTICIYVSTYICPCMDAYIHVYIHAIHIIILYQLSKKPTCLLVEF